MRRPRRSTAIAGVLLAGVTGVFSSMLLTGAGGGTQTPVATATATPTPTATPEPGVANLWVDGSGTCTRQGTAGAYASAAACNSFDAAVNAASSGDVIRVTAGTYAAQRIDGDKTSLTRIIGDGDGDDVTVSTAVSGAVSGFEGFSWCAVCVDSNFVSLENMTLVTDDPGSFGGYGAWGTNDQLVDVDIVGAVSNDPNPGDFYAPSVGINGPDFTWDGGMLGRPGEVAIPTCDHATIEPLWVHGNGDGATFNEVTVRPFVPLSRAGSSCGGDNIPHVETVRLGGLGDADADNVTVSNSHFDTDGVGDHGSGHFFSSTDSDNLLVVNTRIEGRTASPWIQLHTDFSGDGWVFAHNTVTDTLGNALPTGTTLIGNFGVNMGCGGGSNIGNVFSGAASCGSNTYIGATAFGLDSDLKLQAGSPAIGAAELSDYCPGTDFEGTARPQGADCDAGADER
jgi:hypothetical protein